jgi:DNA-binding MarR family transcriptional regulator
MPLQEAQQLQEFADEIFELSKDVWAAQTRSRSREQTELAESEFLALDVLAKAAERLTVGEIQRSIGVLPAQMSRVVRALESKSDEPLIRCTTNPDDKRKIDVELTPAGRKAHQAYRQLKLGSIQKMLQSLSAQDREEFMRILRQIRSSVHKS